MAETIKTNRKRGNIKGQLNKISSYIGDGSTIVELMTYQDITARWQNKFDAFKDDYYIIASEEDFSESEIAPSKLDEDINKLELGIKSSINKLNCFRINNYTQASYLLSEDQPKTAYFKLPNIPHCLTENLKRAIFLKLNLVF